MVRVGRLGLNIVLLADLAAVLVATCTSTITAFFGRAAVNFTRTPEWHS
jgi:hypothetical protein